MSEAPHGPITVRLGPAEGAALFRTGFAVAALVAAHFEFLRLPLYDPARYHVPLSALLSGWVLQALPWLLRSCEVTAVLAALGIVPRAAVALTTAVHALLFAFDQLLFRNHIYLLCLFGLLLTLSPLTSSYSCTGWLRRKGRRSAQLAIGSPPLNVRDRSARIPLLLVQVQTLLVYLFAALHKARGSFLQGWSLRMDLLGALNGSPLLTLLGERTSTRFLIFLTDPVRARALATCTLLAEAAMVPGLLFRRTRPWAACLGIALHLSFYLLMDVLTFGLLMVSSYVLFWAVPLFQPRSAER